MRAKIEKLVYGGEGLAHEGGEAVFVPFVLPGEEVELTPGTRKKKFVRARVTRVLEASPDRVAARCPHFGRCGGCDYQHVSYEAQLRYKEEILRETLRRLGRIDWQGPVTLHASPPWEYRNRAQWKIRPHSIEGGRPREDAGSVARSSGSEHSDIGYFRAGSSTLCPVQVCTILSPKLLATFEQFRAMLSEEKLPETLREVEAFADAEDQGILLNLSCTSLPRGADALAKMLSERIDGVKSILLQDVRGERMSLHGPGFLQYKVMQSSFRVGHLSFFQVNRFLVNEMANVAAAAAGGGELAFDLYAGVGLFATTLAGNFGRVEAVEANPAAARDLETNAGLSGKTIKARNDSAESFLAEWKQKREATPDVVIVDPPRAGIEPTALDKLAAIAPARILYVSCDPSTLARDLANLCTRAYALQEIHLFDMFPQTYHIETLVRLERVR
ncbi:MAG TPA: 23S rRNA (uracil(1939)-C(5))-methyltransferase RlmD [Candidatus Acidoferrales bacterium]|nr:23S rRNA (uracil(1939)-C(5))-methyltransferase RlmD [Candidatus Acidoferrales bacterium]